jgi:hypothetical protein
VQLKQHHTRSLESKVLRIRTHSFLQEFYIGKNEGIKSKGPKQNWNPWSMCGELLKPPEHWRPWVSPLTAGGVALYKSCGAPECNARAPFRSSAALLVKHKHKRPAGRSLSSPTTARTCTHVDSSWWRAQRAFARPAVLVVPLICDRCHQRKVKRTGR